MLVNIWLLALVLLLVASDNVNAATTAKATKAKTTRASATKDVSPETPSPEAPPATSTKASSDTDTDVATKTSSSTRTTTTTPRATGLAWSRYMDKVKGIIALPHSQLMAAGQHHVSYPKNGSHWVASTTNVMEFSASPPSNMYLFVAVPNAFSPIYSVDDGLFFTRQSKGSETKQAFNYDGPNTPADGYFLLLLFSDCNTTTLLDACMWAVSDRFTVKAAGTAVERQPVSGATRRTSVGMGLVLAGVVVSAAAVATVF